MDDGSDGQMHPIDDLDISVDSRFASPGANGGRKRKSIEHCRPASEAKRRPGEGRIAQVRKFGQWSGLDHGRNCVVVFRPVGPSDVGLCDVCGGDSKMMQY